jgi:hypothetical protein
MACNIQWVYGLCPSPGIIINTAFRKLDAFPSSGAGMETPTLFGPLQRANLNHCTSLTDPTESLPPLT